ncbi:ciliary microtubule inner protein 1-like [Corticium candelabrum]|uniref:ciliary microtubule inner protein 1-like n=1 Tax=Corticium candelabrum TaxID=121492 RepID=UPI002E277151|nr:ciliary microtubule inner protein 1-like [Corticium candelabrum]
MFPYDVLIVALEEYHINHCFFRQRAHVQYPTLIGLTVPITMSGSRKAATCNLVHSDEIWKDHVHREASCSREWPKKWGFLSDEYSKLSSQLASFQEAAGRLSKCSISRNATTEAVRLPQISTSRRLTGVSQRCNTFPLTTQREIGWKNATRLEMYGHHARGKLSIEKHLKWPVDGLA